jgi:hypothetical protein
VKDPHQLISPDDVQSELKLRIEEVGKRIKILRAIHDDDQPEKSWIKREQLAQFDVKSSENDIITTLPIGTDLAKIRFQRLYVVLRMLIYLDPMTAGKFLSQFSHLDTSISGTPEKLTDSYCYALRIIDFEVNGKEVIDKAIGIASALSMLIPAGTLAKAAYLARTGNVAGGFLKAALIGLDSPLNTLATLPYVAYAYNEKIQTENLHQAFSNFVSNLNTTVQSGDRRKILENFLAVHQRFETAYTDFLVTAVLSGGAIGMKGLSMTMQRFAKSTRAGKVITAEKYQSNLANFGKFVASSCGR